MAERDQDVLRLVDLKRGRRDWYVAELMRRYNERLRQKMITTFLIPPMLPKGKDRG